MFVAEALGATLLPDEFLAQLEGEHRVKPEVRQRRGIGFVGPAASGTGRPPL